VSHWLIVSGSARALAQSCVAAGRTCDVIDPFADSDTVALATRVARVSCDDGAFGDELVEHVAALKGSWDGIVAGSGFERRPDLLDALCRVAPLLGNDAQTVRRCKSPDGFAAGLSNAGVAFAPVVTGGRTGRGWLMKRTGGCGGAHVRMALDGELIPRGWHAQKQIAGVPASVLFLADGQHARIVGISRLRPGSAAGSFAWCEAIGDLPLDDRCRQLLERDVAAMAREFGLRGLNGADLVLQGGHHVVIEINPRPTATLALYEHRIAGGLFAAHIAACESRLDSVVLEPDSAVHGLRVVYAPHDLDIAAEVEWPSWCADRPATGSRVKKAEPLCTVHAAAADADETVRLLRKREQQMLDTSGRRTGQTTTTTETL
jgi:predicted ATP-grasp superfamily ATP-dependent carboligase